MTQQEIQTTLERSQALRADELQVDDFPHLTQDGTDAALVRLQHQIYDLAEALAALRGEVDDLRESAGLRRG
jgi:hypothetical protein